MKKSLQKSSAKLALLSSAILGAVSFNFAQNANAQISPYASKPSKVKNYKNFKVAIYIVDNTVAALADKKQFEKEYARISSQLKFDKVYIEVFRDRRFVTQENLDAVKKNFAEKGIEFAGGITISGGGGGDGQFGTFDYSDPKDRAEAQKAVELAARNFDEVIMDDFFFFNTKTDIDIATKGEKSWTQYRLETMREVSQNIVLKPAKAANPNVKFIIKYPNWYEHFQGTGYDLDKQPHMFDGLYTGTETRDPEITDQLLQQYESYSIYRYFKNIRPDGHNGGGWVDNYDTRYVDRYAEQLALTMFAKAPEMTLFNWRSFSNDDTIDGGKRPWANLKTSFDWDEIAKAYVKKDVNDKGPNWALAASNALSEADKVVGLLGNPTGIAAYRPVNSSGEDFIHNYLGNMGIPLEMTPHYPTNADTIFINESAKADSKIIDEIKQSLTEGKTIFVTSGFVTAMQDKGFRDILEIEVTGRKTNINNYYNGFGAGRGYSLRDDPEVSTGNILFPDIKFFTNDSWAVIRGVANNKATPILLMNKYSKGTIFVLNIPENMGDIYELPDGVMNQVKTHLQKNAKVRTDGPGHVALFTYDNNSFVLQSFRDEPAKIRVSIDGTGISLKDAVTGQSINSVVAKTDTRDDFRDRNKTNTRTEFEVEILPHSFKILKY